MVNCSPLRYSVNMFPNVSTGGLALELINLEFIQSFQSSGMVDLWIWVNDRLEWVDDSSIASARSQSLHSACHQSPKEVHGFPTSPTSLWRYNSGAVSTCYWGDGGTGVYYAMSVCTWNQTLNLRNPGTATSTATAGMPSSPGRLDIFSVFAWGPDASLNSIPDGFTCIWNLIHMSDNLVMSFCHWNLLWQWNALLDSLHSRCGLYVL